jgi:probable HAF family extracellular repeat protein
MKTRYRVITVTLVAMLIVGLVWVCRGTHDRTLYRVTILPSLGGRVATPTAINNWGEIVGYSEALDGSCHLCLWDPNGRIQDLGPAVRTRYYLNDVGQIAGMTQDSSGKHVAFIRDHGGSMRILGTLGGVESAAQGLNNRGQVVGWARTAEGLKHAFVWERATGIQDLSPAESDGGEARAINDRGQIIGVSDGRARWPTLWTPAGPTWVTEPQRSLFGSSAINAHG